MNRAISSNDKVGAKICQGMQDRNSLLKKMAVILATYQKLRAIAQRLYSLIQLNTEIVDITPTKHLVYFDIYIDCQQT